MRSFQLTLMILMLLLVPVSAETVNLTIDSNQSILGLTGTVKSSDGQLLPLTERYPGSLNIKMSGTAFVEVGTGTISIQVSATGLTPSENVFPIPVGVTAPDGLPADLAGVVVNPDPLGSQGSYAVRGLSVELASVVTSITAQGNFSVTNMLGVFNGNRTFHVGDMGGGGVALSQVIPVVGVNISDSDGSFVGADQSYSLSIPIRFNWPIFSLDLSLQPQSAILEGQIIARVVPEVPAQVISLLLFLVWSSVGIRMRVKHSKATLAVAS